MYKIHSYYGGNLRSASLPQLCSVRIKLGEGGLNTTLHRNINEISYISQLGSSARNTGGCGISPPPTTYRRPWHYNSSSCGAPLKAGWALKKYPFQCLYIPPLLFSLFEHCLGRGELVGGRGVIPTLPLAYATAVAYYDS